MIKAIAGYCKQTGQPVPETYGEITRCIFDSLSNALQTDIQCAAKDCAIPYRKITHNRRRLTQ